MDRSRALRIQRNGIEAWIRATAGVSVGADVIEHDGVIAAVIPAAAQRSIVNSGVHSGAQSLERALPALARAYDEAGVAASAMWTLEPDPAVDRMLEDAGYAFDGEPAAMAAVLAQMPPAELADLDWDTAATPEELGRVNDLAYGYPAGEGVSPAIGRLPAELNPRSYRARAGDGEPAAVMQTIDVGSDCLVIWVATVPQHRGKGLASRLLGAALGEARERGLETTSLQSSMLGRSVYERVGYELIAPLRLHERRG